MWLPGPFVGLAPEGQKEGKVIRCRGEASSFSLLQTRAGRVRQSGSGMANKVGGTAA